MGVTSQRVSLGQWDLVLAHTCQQLPKHSKLHVHWLGQDTNGSGAAIVSACACSTGNCSLAGVGHCIGKGFRHSCAWWH